MQTTSGLKKHETAILGAKFNADNSCFAIAHSSGFRVFNSDPMVQWIARDYDGSIGGVSMLDRTNCLALVGGGENPKYPQTKVVIWDDYNNRVALTLEFVLPVLNVLVTKTRLVVVVHNKIYIYSFPSNPTRLAAFDTAPNPHGIAVIANGLLAFPGAVEGRIELVDTADQKVVSLIRGHKSAIRALALNDRFLASASVTGTIVRIYSLETKSQVHEFRRGLDKATIYWMSFSPSDQLACLSDKSTLHVFEMYGETNRRHALKKLSPLAPKYFGSEWSFVSCQTQGVGPGILGWVGDDTLVVVWQEEGRWEKYVVLRDTQELVREAWRKIDTE